MNPVQTEPVLTLVTAFVGALIALLVAFGVALTGAQIAAISGFVVAAYGLGAFIRKHVWTEKSVEQVVAAVQSRPEVFSDEPVA